MTDLEGLAKRVEALTGPCRETDVRICLAVYGDRVFGFKGDWQRPVPGMLSGYHAAFAEVINVDDAIPDDVVPRYTASVDAALTLVPEGWWLAGLSFNHADFRSSADREWHAEIAGPVTWAVLDRHVGEEPQFECEGGNATTPALALCAAALRAQKGD